MNFEVNLSNLFICTKTQHKEETSQRKLSTKVNALVSDYYVFIMERLLLYQIIINKVHFSAATIKSTMTDNKS